MLPLNLIAAPVAWPITAADAIPCANMVHVSPWAATQGLLRAAGGGPLVLYGPYRRNGVLTAPSNEAFDADLRRRDSRWGLRQLEDVVWLGGEHGMALERVVEMPANNVVVVLRRSRSIAPADGSPR